MLTDGYIEAAAGFKKLQRACENPAFQESEIEAAVYRLLLPSVKSRMAVGQYGVEAAGRRELRFDETTL